MQSVQSALAAKDETEIRDILAKAAKKFEESNKKEVSFSCKELGDEHFGQKGLALKMNVVGPPITESFFISPDEPAPKVSDWLCDTLSRIHQVWKLTNQKARRILIDAILTDVIFSDQELRAVGYCEVPVKWESEDFSFNGYSDYLIGSKDGAKPNYPDSDCFLLIVEAKNEINYQGILQALAQAACIQKCRDAAKPTQTPMFAVLTDAFSFRFFAIDERKQVYCSRLLPLTFTSMDWKTNDSLQEILRWFKWVLGAMKSVSPRFYDEDRTCKAKARSGQGSMESAAAGPGNDRYADYRAFMRLPGTRST